MRERIADIDEALNKRQSGLGFGEHSGLDAQKRKALEDERETLQGRLVELQEGAADIKSKDFEQFFWELDFPEVFSRRKGFDIVIGNPPYVRQVAPKLHCVRQ